MSNNVAPFINDENRIAANNFLSMLDPRRVRDSIENAEAHLRSVNAFSEAMALRSYRVMYDVYHNETWKKASYIDAKGITKKYSNFVEWAERVTGKKKQTAYNAKNAGSLILEDGSGTVLHHEDPKKDFTFTHLTNMIDCADIYEDGDKKKPFRVIPWYVAKRVNGKVYKFNNGYVYEEVRDAEGRQLKANVLTVLADMLILTPEMPVSKVKGVIHTFMVENDYIEDVKRLEEVAQSEEVVQPEEVLQSEEVADSGESPVECANVRDTVARAIDLINKKMYGDAVALLRSLI